MLSRLNVRNEMVRQVANDKRFLNALALVVCIKMKYHSSVIHKYDIKSLKTQFKSSSETISSALKYAKELGLLKEVDGVLIAQKISISFKLDSSVWRNETIVFKGEITIKNIKKELLKLSMVNYLRNRNKIYSQKVLEKEPNNIREYKKIKSNVTKWGIDKYDTSKGISYSSIAIKTNTSVRKVIYTIKELVRDGLITKVTPERKRVNCFKREFPLFYEKYSFEFNGMTFIQEPNLYSITPFPKK
jgi:predicted transcriptional regulator